MWSHIAASDVIDGSITTKQINEISRPPIFVSIRFPPFVLGRTKQNEIKLNASQRKEARRRKKGIKIEERLEDFFQ